MRSIFKRYWLFDCPSYYPGGGMNDFVDSFATMEEAEQRAKSIDGHQSNWHILDTFTAGIRSMNGWTGTVKDLVP